MTTLHWILLAFVIVAALIVAGDALVDRLGERQ